MGDSNNNNDESWKSSKFDCTMDWETCWWGSWCCCLLSSRTAGIFKFGSSFLQAFLFISAIVISLFLLPFSPLASLCTLAFSLIGNVFYRTSFRSRIRSAYHIQGTTGTDFMEHCCCSCCSVCQEAREAKLRFVLFSLIL